MPPANPDAPLCPDIGRSEVAAVAEILQDLGPLVTRADLPAVQLEPGDSWVVPQVAEHSFRILEAFTTVEATSPPSQVHGRDDS